MAGLKTLQYIKLGDLGQQPGIRVTLDLFAAHGADGARIEKFLLRKSHSNNFCKAGVESGSCRWVTDRTLTVLE